MRISLFILASLILLYLLAIQAFSQSPSQPIAGYDEVSGSFSTGGGSLSEEAQASRAAQNGQPVKGADAQTFSIGTRYFGTMNPQQSSRVQNQTIAIRPVMKVTTSAEISSAGIANVSGSWSLKLDNNTSGKANLSLFQNGNAVYGTGNINQGTNTTLQAAASGTVTDSRLNLYLVSLGKVSLYSFSLTISKDSVNGSYSALTPGESQIIGTAKGERFLPFS
ncbi:Uncharacterised protein [uncultured archaeon]|nr:Uncharacterised protein [uncultured archaeon]